MLRLLLALNLLGERHRTYMNTMYEAQGTDGMCSICVSCFLGHVFQSKTAHLYVFVQALSLSLSLSAAPDSPTDLA